MWGCALPSWLCLVFNNNNNNNKEETRTRTRTIPTTGTTTTNNFQLNAARTCSVLCGRLPLWHSLLGQNRLRLNSEWHLSKAPKLLDRRHSEMSMRPNPVGGLRVFKTLLALTRRGALPTYCRNRQKGMYPERSTRGSRHVGATIIPASIGDLVSQLPHS